MDRLAFEVQERTGRRVTELRGSSAPMFGSLSRLHWYTWKALEFPGLHRQLGDLRREAALSLEEWQDLQRERLRHLLVEASENVPYYRELFREVGFDPRACDLPTELSRVPLLTKERFRRAGDRLLSSAMNRGRLHGNATGGSTGTPLNFLQDGFYLETTWALDAYVRGWWGVAPYDKTASIWGADRDLSEQSYRERLYHWRSRTRFLNAFRMRSEDLGSFAEMLLHWKPPFLKGYASALEALAHYYDAGDRERPTFRAICSSAEKLWPHQRQLIERVFESPVFDFYGSREASSLAAECPEGRRLHAISTWKYIEIVDDDGNPVDEGQSGHVVVTDLSNRAMPFIRYVNGDVARLSSARCTCGRPSPTIGELLGRSSDFIRSPNGDLIHGEFFTHLFYGSDDILQFQVHQLSLNHLVVRYVSGAETAEDSMRKISTKIREKMGADVLLEIQPCREIPTPTSGKHRFTISEVGGWAGLRQEKGNHAGAH